MNSAFTRINPVLSVEKYEDGEALVYIGDKYCTLNQDELAKFIIALVSHTKATESKQPIMPGTPTEPAYVPKKPVLTSKSPELSPEEAAKAITSTGECQRNVNHDSNWWGANVLVDGTVRRYTYKYRTGARNAKATDNVGEFG